MIIAVTIALLALVGTQVYWISDAVQLKEEEYIENTKTALYNSIHKYKSNQHIAQPEVKRRIKVNHTVNGLNVRDSIILSDSDEVTVKIIEKINWSEDGKTMNKTCFIIADTLNFDSLYQSMAEEHHVIDVKEKTQMSWQTDSVVTITNFNSEQGVFELRQLQIKRLDSIFNSELKSLGIDNSYYLIAGYEEQEPTFFNNEEAKNNWRDVLKNEKTISAEIFEADMKQTAMKAYVLFPGQQTFLLGEIWWVMVVSGFIIVVLILSFYYSIRTILHQKKLSVVKNDFINNMTHELKTPISTIGLACEMLNDESINTSAEKKKTYITMIREENKRLGTLVESVLQSAVIERGELTIKPEPLDVNELIEDVVGNFDLQIKKREGHIALKLNAAHHFIMGDSVHLSNVIFNLLDNATKYSFEAPEITISSGNANDKLIISVSDKGIGINKEDQKKIFEKLYRIPTGNVHNVKGFGLGLSYVKAVIEKHSGEVTVDSEAGKGSTFTLSLPIYHGKEN